VEKSRGVETLNAMDGVKTDTRGEQWRPLALCLAPAAPWRHRVSLNETNGINDVQWSITDVTNGPGINLTHGPHGRPLAGAMPMGWKRFWG